MEGDADDMICHETTESEDGESVCSWDAEEEQVDGDRPPKLYNEYQAARLNLRFSVGQTVYCAVDGGRAEGLVVKRFYREEEWPKGYYAAVRALAVKQALQLPTDNAAS